MKPTLLHIASIAAALLAASPPVWGVSVDALTVSTPDAVVEIVNSTGDAVVVGAEEANPYVLAPTPEVNLEWSPLPSFEVPLPAMETNDPAPDDFGTTLDSLSDSTCGDDSLCAAAFADPPPELSYNALIDGLGHKKFAVRSRFKTRLLDLLRGGDGVAVYAALSARQNDPEIEIQTTVTQLMAEALTIKPWDFYVYAASLFKANDAWKVWALYDKVSAVVLPGSDRLQELRWVTYPKTKDDSNERLAAIGDMGREIKVGLTAAGLAVDGYQETRFFRLRLTFKDGPSLAAALDYSPETITKAIPLRVAIEATPVDLSGFFTPLQKAKLLKPGDLPAFAFSGPVSVSYPGDTVELPKEFGAALLDFARSAFNGSAPPIEATQVPEAYPLLRAR